MSMKIIYQKINKLKINLPGKYRYLKNSLLKKIGKLLQIIVHAWKNNLGTIFSLSHLNAIK